MNRLGFPRHIAAASPWIRLWLEVPTGHSARISGLRQLTNILRPLVATDPNGRCGRGAGTGKPVRMTARLSKPPPSAGPIHASQRQLPPQGQQCSGCCHWVRLNGAESGSGLDVRVAASSLKFAEFSHSRGNKARFRNELILFELASLQRDFAHIEHHAASL